MSFANDTTFALGGQRYISPQSNSGFASCIYPAAALQASLAWPTANMAVYTPVRILVPTLIKQFFCMNGATVSGNVDVGVYTFDGVRVSSAGSTAQAGTNAIQTFNVTDFMLGQGTYYMAIALSNTTGTFFSNQLATNIWQMEIAGVLEQTSAFPLPATATFAAISTTTRPTVIHGMQT